MLVAAGRLSASAGADAPGSTSGLSQANFLWDAGCLDSLAAAGMPQESLEDAIRALCQGIAPEMAQLLAPVLEHEGAADRTLLLKVLRASGGSGLMNKSAVAALPALAQGELEQMVLRANPSGQAGGWSNAPPLAKEEPHDDDPADTQHLRRL